MKKFFLIFSIFLSMLTLANTVSGVPKSKTITCEETDFFEKIIKDKLSNGNYLEINWVHQVLNDDWNKFFGICACHYTIDVTSSSVRAGRRRRARVESSRDREDVAAEETIVFEQEETKVKLSSNDFHILVYAEFDDNDNISFKYVNLPISSENGQEFQYMKNVAYEDFVKAEVKDLEIKNLMIEGMVSSANDQLNEIKTRIENAMAYVSEDNTGNPVCKFDVSFKGSIKSMEKIKADLLLDIFRCDDRRELHRRLFEDYSENSKAYDHKLQVELDNIIDEAKKLKMLLAERKDEALKIYWKERHERELKEENEKTVEDIKDTLETELERARSSNIALLSSVSGYEVGLRKKVVIDLFKQNIENAQYVVDLINYKIASKDLENDRIDVQEIIDSVEDIDIHDVDLKPMEELESLAAEEISKKYTKTDKDLEDEDRKFITKNYKFCKLGTKIKIDCVINGNTYKFNGLYQKVGPDKITIGGKVMTFGDLPKELQECMKTKKEYDEFITKEIEKHPVSRDYRKEKHEETQKLVYQMLIKQFEENVPKGYFYLNKRWFSKHDLARHFLLENTVSAR